MWNISKIKTFSQKNWPLLLLLLVSILFFLGTSYYNYAGQSKNFIKWSSPDETANYTFAKLYAEEGKLEIPERYNLLVKDIVHPRSFRVFDGVLKPMSFLGIILLYGQIGHIFGAEVIPYLTPLFGSIGLWFFYFLLKELFNRRVALLGAIILAIFPIYFYYTSKSMFHNILFVVLLMGGLLFTIRATKIPKETTSTRIEWKKIFYFCLGGLLLGWAVATRTSELLWLGPVFLILYLLNWRRIAIWQALLVVGCALISLIPIFYQNILLYGGPFKSGYAEVNTSISVLTTSSNSLIKQAANLKHDNSPILLAKKIFHTIFYFGFKPSAAFDLFWKYSLAISPWLIYGSILGLVIWLSNFQKIKKGQLHLLVAFIIVSGILITYYGSWDFHDNPDVNAVTIGNSYTRYWLPIYLCLIAWLALALDRISKLTSRTYLSWSIKIFIILLFSLSSWKLVFGAGAESLTTNINKGKVSQHQQIEVLKLTEPNAVIITKYQDKLFFPERKVVYGLLEDKGMLKEYAILARYLPTYFYSFTFPNDALEYLNRRRLSPYGLKLNEVKTIDEFTLYRLISK